jgi:oxygen-independent coproporphyrinogen-3 oxidase
MNTVGIYVQVPFCASKCSFCNFSSRVAHESVFAGYCRAIEQEVERLSRPASPDAAEDVARTLVDFVVDTLYLGGGTPSIVGRECLQHTLGALRRHFQFTASPEMTIEITPGSADDDLLECLRALGVNRLSVGAQSFEDCELRAVGRLHSAAETVGQVLRARANGFGNISLDLIGGLPHQTQASWLRSLRAALDLKPEHVSVYLFEVDEKSRLGNEVLHRGGRYHASAVPDDDFMAWAYETACEMLAGAGYRQYEISNFAWLGYESRHNLKYWELKPYLGLGAGAHSFDGIRRWSNEVLPEVYVAKLGRGESPVREVRTLALEEQLEEFFFLGLRQCRGVDLALAAQRWGEERFARWKGRIEKLEQDGWVERHDKRLRIPEQAYLVSNEIFQEFLL